MMRDWFKQRDTKTTPADALVGEQPGAHFGAMLGEDARVVAAIDRHRNSDTLLPTMPSPGTVMALPLVREVEAPPEDWSADTYLIQPGDVIQILGRTPHRQDFAVHNQSGNAVPVYLFPTHDDAKRFVNATVKPTQGRFVIVADGPDPRNGHHSGGVWAAVHPTAAAAATIDVTASIYRGPRP